QFERPHHAVGNDSESHAADLRRITKVLSISLDDNFFVLRLLNETKGAGADRVARKIRAGIRGNDADGRRNEIHAEGSVRLAEMKNDCGVVGRFDRGDHAKGALFWGFVGGILDEIEGRFYIGGG